MNEIARIALLTSLLAMFTLPTLTIHAVAGTPPPPQHVGAPGPLLGAGLPFLGIVGGVYWITRRLRRKSD
jgi:hypothetical protein